MTNKKCIVLVSIILLIVMLVSGCSAPQAKSGDAVSVNYTGKLQDGTVFDSSEEGKPLEFTLGEGRILPGLEQAVLGMKIGESKTVTIPVDQAFGPRRDDLIQVVPRNQLPEDLEPEVGMQLQTTGSDGGILVITIVEVSETTVTIDANPDLAGKDLIFDIKLIGIGKSGSNASPGASTPSDQIFSSGKPTLAEFGRGTCIPCKQMKPILEELSKEYEGRMTVLILDIDDYRDLTYQFKIMSIPTQVVLDANGKEIYRHIGLWPKNEIIAELNKLGIK